MRKGKKVHNQDIGLSLIVPVYNVEKYLGNCIESILNQTYKNFEVILVNDGSLDSSGKICEYYAANDKRIKVINKSNGGLSSARNIGIEKANGKYFIFIDSDDSIHPQMCEIMYNIIEKYAADIVASNFICDIDHKNSLYKVIDKVDLYQLTNVDTLRWLLNEFGFPAMAWGKIYKRELFSELRYKEGMLYEDLDLIYKVLDISKKVIFIDEQLSFYRINNESISRSKFNAKKLIDRNNISNELIKFVSDKHNNLMDNVFAYSYMIKIYILSDCVRDKVFNKEFFDLCNDVRVNWNKMKKNIYYRKSYKIRHFIIKNNIYMYIVLEKIYQLLSKNKKINYDSIIRFDESIKQLKEQYYV